MNRTPSQLLVLKVLVVSLYLLVFWLLIGNWLTWLWFGLGVVFGISFLMADEHLFVNWYQEEKNNYLVTRSPLFLLALLPLSVMVLTSFGSLWASGAVGAMMLWLLLEMSELRKSPAGFKDRFLQKMKVEDSMINPIIVFGWVFFLLIHLLAIY